MLERRDRFCGNILLYEYLATKRNPVFLNRSLTRALQAHQYLLSKDTLAEDQPGPDHDARFKWRPPSWDDLDDMVALEASNGSFNLEVHSIRLQGAQPTTRSSDRTSRARKARALLRANTSITASFYPEGSQICGVKLTETAVLKADHRSVNGRVTVDMDPIAVKPQDLASNSRPILSGNGCSMEISMNFASVNEAREFYEYIGVTGMTWTPLQLVAVYDNIMQCPVGSDFIRLEDQAKQVVLDLEICMYWANTTALSILERSNRKLRSREKLNPPYVTPPLDTDRRSGFLIRYIYGDKIVERSSLACPLDGCRVRRLLDVKDLRMHLDSLHDHFRYTATQEMVDDQGVQHWRFDCEITDHRSEQRASEHADEPFDNHVNAPSQPFDVGNYLDGNTEFHQVATQRLPSRFTWSKGKPTSLTATQLPLRRKPPEEVQARPIRPKKRYIVPEAPPGIVLFRSATKQPLEAGQVISESDDELDLEWMQLRKKAEIGRETISVHKKRFQILFDEFMEDEHVQADIHVSDAVVRFTRERGSLIFAENLLGELRSKLEELLEDKIISKDVQTACLDMIPASRTETPNTDEILQQLTELQVQAEKAAVHTTRHRTRRRPSRDRSREERALLTNTGHLTPVTADSDGDLEVRNAILNPNSRTIMQSPLHVLPTEPAYDECYCGEDAMSTHSVFPVIACSRVDCIRRYFHTACVQRRTNKPLPPYSLKKRDWVCGDCQQV